MCTLASAHRGTRTPPREHETSGRARARTRTKQHSRTHAHQAAHTQAARGGTATNSGGGWCAPQTASHLLQPPRRAPCSPTHTRRMGGERRQMKRVSFPPSQAPLFFCAAERAAGAQVCLAILPRCAQAPKRGETSCSTGTMKRPEHCWLSAAGAPLSARWSPRRRDAVSVCFQ